MYVPYADRHYEPDLPSREDLAHDENVGYITHLFSKLSLPDRPYVFELEHALSSLLTATRSFEISDRQFEELLEMILLAHAAVLVALPQIDERFLEPGMRAAAGLAIWWAESDEQRKQHHPHVYPDMRDSVLALTRVLRAELLLEYIEGRRTARRAALVEQMLYGSALKEIGNG